MNKNTVMILLGAAAVLWYLNERNKKNAPTPNYTSGGSAGQPAPSARTLKSYLSPAQLSQIAAAENKAKAIAANATEKIDSFISSYSF